MMGIRIEEMRIRATSVLLAFVSSVMMLAVTMLAVMMPRDARA